MRKLFSCIALLLAVVLVLDCAAAGDWQVAGSGCVVQNGIQARARGYAYGTGLQFADGSTGTIVAHCPVTTPDVSGSPYNLAVYFQDSDGAGSSGISIVVHRMDKRPVNNGAVSLVCGYASNIDGDTEDTDRQVDIKPCITAVAPADPNTYFYFAFAFISRATDTPVPIFLGLELYKPSE